MTDAEKQEIVDALQGTCNSLCEAYDGDDMAVFEYIDEHIFNCACCGWWCEAGDYATEDCEATGEDICSQCEGEYI